MDIVIFYFLILIVIPAILIAWGVRIVKSFRRKNQKSKTRYVELVIFSALIIFVTWDLKIFPFSKNFYVKQLSEQITGKQFWSWKEFEFEEISVRGEGYSVFAYKFNKEMANYFLDPDDDFFEKYPQKPEYRKNWESIKWEKTPIRKDEVELLDIATPTYYGWSQSKLDKMDLVEEMAKQNGNYYAYNTNGSDIDFYMINPENRLIIMINHNQ